jgi:hypothetical protein
MYRNTTNHNSRGPFNPFVQDGGTSTQTFSSQEAIITDVIVNDQHPEYGKDGYNIGAVQFRFLKSNAYREQGALSWALPLESNISEYPLLNEVVFVVSSLNRFYYTKKISLSDHVTAHPIYGLNEELSPISSDKDKVQDYRSSVGIQKKDDSSAKSKLGKYFKDLPSVKRLRHDEGDMILEGRSGHSIRFGSSWLSGTNFKSTSKDQSPNLLFRVGPLDSQKHLTVENINDDASSIWMVSDQLVALNPATMGNSIHGASVADLPKKLEGNQIVVNTDRLVINTKKGKILGFAYSGIHWTTLQNFSVDAGQDYLSTIGRNSLIRIKGFMESTAGSRHSIMSPKMYFGSKNDETEPVVCGALLAKFLQDFIDLHIKNAPKHVITPTGPGILNPQILQGLIKLKADVAKGRYSSFNSTVAYTVKNN